VTKAALTPERILDKANVVDVARALDVSHGSVYRHPSKAALRDAVAERWLAGISVPLDAVAMEQGPASERLRRWLDLLVSSKQTKALDDPELFATYVELTAEARDVVKAHVDALVAQLARIIADGVAQDAFEKAVNPVGAARAVFDATARFHNPAQASAWGEPGIDAAYEAVRALVLRGLERERPRGRT
jgi:AcrR family transcriptional regulator